MSQVVIDSPERLLDQTVTLYEVLHGCPPPPLADDADNFILGRVAMMTKQMLQKLGVTQLPDDSLPVMQRIRHHTNLLSAELVGRELSDDVVSTVTLVDLIQHMQCLTDSVSQQRATCTLQ